MDKENKNQNSNFHSYETNDSQDSISGFEKNISAPIGIRRSDSYLASLSDDRDVGPTFF
ncbi:hypothetical protein LEP1GSC086_1678 [Leptospira weilii str. LNT 1234]|nr:hypothetical protein LEP1GSC086_1678 [Leptospira weilii str. LNT 1234]